MINKYTEQFILFSMSPYVMRHPFVQLASAAQAASPHALPACLLAWWCEKPNSPWVCASTAQQQLKHGSVISTVLATDLQHSNILAAVRKISSIPASPSTEFKPKSLPSVVTFISPYICHLQCLFRKIKTHKKFVKQVTCLSLPSSYIFSPFFPCL